MHAQPKPPPRIVDKHRRAQEAANLIKAVYDEVDARDNRRCRCCDRRGFPHDLDPLWKLHHCHILDASLGGNVTPANIFLGCALCHTYIHAKQLFVIGTDARHELQFEIYQAAAQVVFKGRPVPSHVRVVQA